MIGFNGDSYRLKSDCSLVVHFILAIMEIHWNAISVFSCIMINRSCLNVVLGDHAVVKRCAMKEINRIYYNLIRPLINNLYAF